MTESLPSHIKANDLRSIELSGINFSQEELNQWQLAFLTSAQDETRLEAFRRLLLSQLESDVKSKICYQAILTGTLLMQKEALVAFKNIHSDQQSTQVFDLLVQLLDEELTHVDQVCHQLMRVTIPREQGLIAISLLIQQFKAIKNEQVKQQLLHVIKEHQGFMQHDHVAVMVSQLISSTPVTRSLILFVLRQWARQQEHGRFLYEEHERYAMDDINDWLFSIIVDSGYDSEHVFKKVVDHLYLQKELGDPPALCSIIVNSPVNLLAYLLKNYDKSCRPKYTFFIIKKIIENEGVDQEQFSKLFDFCVQQLNTGRRDIIPALIELPFDRNNIDVKRYQLWLRELFLVREEFSSEFLLNEIDYRIRRSGPLAFDMLKDTILYSIEEKTRLHALKLLCQVIPNETAVLQEASDLFLKLLQDQEIDQGELYQAFGLLWAYDRYPEQLREQQVSQYMRDLWRKSPTLERFEGLSHAIPIVKPPLAAQVTLTFLELLEKRLPKIEKVTAKRNTDLLDSALREQRYLVAGLVGASQALKRDDLLPDLLERLIVLLQKSWQKIVEGSISWGPDGSRHLIRALVSLANHQKEHRQPTIGLLLKELNFIEVQRGLIVLWEYLSQENLDDISTWLLKKLNEPKQLEIEEFESLLDLCKKFLEDIPGGNETNAIKVFNKLHSLRRFAPQQMKSFFDQLVISNEKLMEFSEKVSF